LICISNHIIDQSDGPVHYLRRQDIDLNKWNACIAAATNGLIYARSFYLDAMTAGQWDALVLEDYKAVMPLPWRRKFGFYYLYQPDFIPALGIFGNGSIADFLPAIPKKFTFWEIDLNESNSIDITPSELRLKKLTRINHFLSLDRPYNIISGEYKRLARRMCKKALDQGLAISRQTPPADIIELYRRQYGSQHTRIGRSGYERLTACAETALGNGNAATYLARWPDNSIGAFYLILADDRFVYSLLGGSTPQGKEKGAFYGLTDAVIRDYAGSQRTFRFEGSDIPGIAFFDAQFGPSPVNYTSLVMNNLPFPVNLFK
jgi:hypothetical protein